MKKVILLSTLVFLISCLSISNVSAQKQYKRGPITTGNVKLKRTEKKGNVKTYNKRKKSIQSKPYMTSSSSPTRANRQNKTINRRKKLPDLQ